MCGLFLLKFKNLINKIYLGNISFMKLYQVLSKKRLVKEDVDRNEDKEFFKDGF